MGKHLRFVVQEHHARQRHYDLRLEMGGVLKSWALPKGPSMNPAEKRLAVMVEDHALAYLNYEGIIPPGLPGAGPVLLWDRGAYDLTQGGDPLEALKAGKIYIDVSGKILKGGFTLVKMKGRGEKNWLLIKKKDAYSQTHWALEEALTEERRGRLREKTPPCQTD